MNDEYRQSEDYARMAGSLIATEDIFADLRAHPARIRFLESNKPAKKSGRVILGECIKVSNKVRNLMAAVMSEDMVPDFFIVIYKERIQHFTPAQLRILIMHELMHIDVKVDDDGKVTYSVRKHNVEDFDYILLEYGLNWAGDFDGQMSWQELADIESDPKEGSVA